jgi:hypothetical protein
VFVGWAHRLVSPSALPRLARQHSRPCLPSLPSLPCLPRLSCLPSHICLYLYPVFPMLTPPPDSCPVYYLLNLFSSPRPLLKAMVARVHPLLPSLYCLPFLLLARPGLAYSPVVVQRAAASQRWSVSTSTFTVHAPLIIPTSRLVTTREHQQLSPSSPS